MGVQEFKAIEFDSLAMANVHPGFFHSEYVGDSKVESVQAAITSVIDGIPDSDIFIDHVGHKVEESFPRFAYDVVVVGTDSLASRREAFRRFYQPDKLWIDARMGGPACDCYALTPNTPEETVEKYKQSLEGKGDPLPCGMKATAPLTKGFLPGMIGAAVRDYVNGKEPLYYCRYSMDDRGFYWEAS
jgi:hypothetical protein